MTDPIQTHNIYPPIPIRDYDWTAYRDPERRAGYGATEDLAILDLLELEASDAEENDPDPYECDCGARYNEAVSVLVCRENGHE